jgi:hypothetical protein
MTFGIAEIASLTNSATGIGAGMAAQKTAGKTSGDKARKGAIAAEVIGGAGSVFAAAAAANAIPVAGQFVSAGLAIAGLLTKIFVGRKQKKKEEAKKKKDTQESTAADKLNASGGGEGGGVGLAKTSESQISSAPVAPAIQPKFSTYGNAPGQQAPAVQPTQQALNNQMGIQ